MDIGAIFLILAVIILAGLFISRPFTDHLPNRASTPNPAGANEYERSNLVAEYDRQLNALQEMDFDHRLGKIPDEDYLQQRQALVRDAAEILRRLDASEPVAPPAPAIPAGGNDKSAEDQAAGDAIAHQKETAPAGGDDLEALIAARRKKSSPTAGDDLEALIAARRRARQEKASGFCPSCGKPVQESDRFCPKCGARL